MAQLKAAHPRLYPYVVAFQISVVAAVAMLGLYFDFRAR